MSVLIKGIDMPKEQTLDAFVIFPSGYVAIYNKEGSLIGEAEAVPVPSHGRLIDGDALCEIMTKHAEKHGGLGGLMVMLAETCVEAAPTIIPAEEGNENYGNLY